ncbi:MAG: chemotaxis response regulator protein-glutamate methylesterase [Terracidiphilus sp.]|jgi:two-component system chemotaxis response regulator CheB
MRVGRRHLLPGEQVRVLIVDDSVVVRRLLTQALNSHPSLEVVGAAPDGSVALQRMAQFSPDVVTLDIEMPGMNGLEVLRQIRRDFPAVRVIMFSTLTECGAAMTLDALTLGADDYVTKTAKAFSGDAETSTLQHTLIPKILQFFHLPDQNPAGDPGAGPAPSAKESAPFPSAAGGQPKVVVLGISTGGPTALGAILPQIPASFPLPILIVQHMPPVFTRLLAERLNKGCALRVEEATPGAIVEQGRILIAPGDFHMSVAPVNGHISIALDQSPPQNFCRPAVDVLFRSAAEVYGGSAIAVVLTGMGQDGLRGARALKGSGARVLAQDEATSVVWGMPGAVAGSGIADRILPLQEIVPVLNQLAARGGSSK